MMRWLVCAVQMLLAAMFSMPGCVRNQNALHPAPQPTQVYGLSVGTPAPEISGEDIDGQSFKLSDYRGKVVLLDFWGNW